MEYGLVGKSLKHSFSKEIHNSLAKYNYELFEMSKEELIFHLKEKDFKGFNITIPYKEEVIPYLDEITDNAREIGSVNTIKNDKGKLIGENTDILGLELLLKRKKINLENKKVLILGSGGTAKTAYTLCKIKKADKVFIVSRKKDTDNFITYDESLNNHTDANIIINTTPVGMFPETNSTPILLDLFNNLEAVVDVIYNPIRSKLLLEAKKKNENIITASGLFMLVSQAIKSAEFFTEKKYKRKIYEKSFSRILKNKQNVILIGMPSSGKSTIGRYLSDILKRELIDTDKLIVQKEKKTIPGIFKDNGEEYFRNIEKEIINEISNYNNKVIATGGGVILNKENINNLKKNGILVYLKAPAKVLYERIKNQNNRPLLQNENPLKTLQGLLQKREKNYMKADIIIETENKSVAEIAQEVSTLCKL